MNNCSLQTNIKWEVFKSLFSEEIILPDDVLATLMISKLFVAQTKNGSDMGLYSV
jgi:hypothetical protein